MLSKRHSQLLTAFVDGELSRRERKVVLRLLNRSSEARRLLRELQEDAHRLHELPKLKLEADFSKQILSAIEEQQLPVHTVTMRQAPEVTPARFLRAALAATILIAVSLGVYYLFFNERSEGPGRAPMVNKNQKHNDLIVRDPVLHIQLATLAHPQKRSKFTEDVRKNFAPNEQDVPIMGASTIGLLGSTVGHGNIVASGALFPGRVKKGVHVELPCLDGKDAVNQLTSAFEKSGINIVLPNMTKTDSDTEFMVFAENLKPEQVTEILHQLGNGKKSANQKKEFNSVAVSAFNVNHQNSLASLMGVDAHRLEPPTAEPLPNELFQRFILPKGKGASAPKAQPKPRPKDRGLSKSALVVANRDASNVRSRVLSYLGSRERHQPGTMQVVFILRPRARA